MKITQHFLPSSGPKYPLRLRELIFPSIVRYTWLAVVYPENAV